MAERTSATGRLARLRSGLVAAPAYPANDADRREIEILGVRLPRRAAAALAIVTLLQVFDRSRTLVPKWVLEWGRSLDLDVGFSFDRAFLFGVVPLLVVLLVFRDRPGRYGLGLGDWRWGIGLALVGVAAMTPIVLAVVQFADFQRYYQPLAADLGHVAIRSAIDLYTAEFFYRGFLMMTLLRVMGPLALIVVQMPFVFAHVGKPELELVSTLFGGAAYAWLAWRTGSIWYGATAHVVIYTMLIVAAGAAAS